MTATGRLLFLLLVTGLFVRIWTEDTHATQERRLARLRAHHARVVAYRVPDQLPRPLLNVVMNSPVKMPRADTLLPAPWRLATCPTTVPPGLTAGTYRMVDNVGQVGLLDVTNDDLAFHGLSTDATPLDLYTQSAGQTRWFFIRLQSAASGEILAVETPTDPPVTISSVPDHEHRRFNRKFDFTGYQ